MLDLSPPQLQRFCTLEVEVGTPRFMGQGRFGERRMIPIIGGRVTGPHLTGRVLDSGADWQTVNAEGVTELTARYVIEAENGALIEIVNSGFRHGPKEVMMALASGAAVDPSTYYMRSSAKLECGHADFAHLNKTMFLGTGARNATLVQIDLYAVN